MNLKQRALTNNGAEGVPKVTKCFSDFASAKKLDFECPVCNVTMLLSQRMAILQSSGAE